MKQYKKIKVLLMLAAFGPQGVTFADEDRSRDSLFSADNFYEEGPAPSKEQLKRVNEAYLKDVKPIFQTKCLPCHGVTADLPWYYALPGAKQLIDQDIAEAKEHLDMSADYPFKGHGTPRSDLKAIKDTVKERTMPPFRYWIMHWGSSINSGDENVIIKWIEESLSIMDEGAKE